MHIRNVGGILNHHSTHDSAIPEKRAKKVVEPRLGYFPGMPKDEYEEWLKQRNLRKYQRQHAISAGLLASKRSGNKIGRPKKKV